MHLRSLTLVIRLTYLALMLMLVTACVTKAYTNLTQHQIPTPTPEPEVDAFHEPASRPTVNLGNAWGTYRGRVGVTLREEFFQLIHQKGFTAVRLPVLGVLTPGRNSVHN